MWRMTKGLSQTTFNRAAERRLVMFSQLRLEGDGRFGNQDDVGQGNAGGTSWDRVSLGSMLFEMLFDLNTRKLFCFRPTRSDRREDAFALAPEHHSPAFWPYSCPIRS